MALDRPAAEAVARSVRCGYRSATMGGRVVVFVLTVLGLAALAEPAAASCVLQKMAELPVTMEGLTPTVPAKVNGVDATLIADSGAFFSLITPEGAAKFKMRVGSAPSWLGVRGANGSVAVRVGSADDFQVLGAQLHHVDFLIGAPQFGGKADGLLGQNLLGVADAEYDLANGVIRLFNTKDCGHQALAYWSQGQPYSVIDIRRTTPSEPHIRGTASVNGVKIGVLFDTGAPTSMLTLKAASRAGVETSDAGVTSAGVTGGIGRRLIDSWSAPFKSFQVGDEQIRNTRLRIGAIELPDADMVLGADFFLSHRIYVAKSQRKLYLTYNGGAVFRLGSVPASAPQVAPTPSASADAPTDAGGFARRGAAFAARRDFAHAIADFTRAIELEPKVAKHYVDRARARNEAGQTELAAKDLDEAIKLKPDDVGTLLARGVVRLKVRDLPGAKSDFDAALRLDPTQTFLVTGIYTEDDMFEPAIAALDAWIAAHPKDETLASALNNRCWALAMWNHDLDKALADCNAAIKLRPKNAGYLDSRGMVHLRRGEFDASIADYDAALKLEPKEPWSLYGRGLAELRKGQIARGEDDLKASAAIDPDLAEHAKRLELAP